MGFLKKDIPRPLPPPLRTTECEIGNKTGRPGRTSLRQLVRIVVLEQKVNEIFALHVSRFAHEFDLRITISGNDLFFTIPSRSWWDSLNGIVRTTLCFTFSHSLLNTFIRRIPLPFFETFPIIEYPLVTKKFASKLSFFLFNSLKFFKFSSLTRVA